jgi:hypothetical protein
MGKAGLAAGAETATGFVLAEAAAWPVLVIAIAIMGAFIALAVALVLVISLVKSAVEKMKAASLEGQIE